jgi:hypothetical protein
VENFLATEKKELWVGHILVHENISNRCGDGSTGYFGNIMDNGYVKATGVTYGTGDIIGFLI